MKTIEMRKVLKAFPESAEISVDDGKGGLLPVRAVRIAKPEEKVEAGMDPDQPVVIIDV